MNQESEKSILSDKRVLLSTLWIFAMFNYLYADVFTLMDSKFLKMLLSGGVGAVSITPETLLVGAVLMETAMVMVVLSRILKYRINRIANIVVGVIHTLAVLLSMLSTAPSIYYVFFVIIETVSTVAIIFIAFKWKEKEA